MKKYLLAALSSSLLSFGIMGSVILIRIPNQPLTILFISTGILTYIGIFIFMLFIVEVAKK